MKRWILVAALLAAVLIPMFARGGGESGAAAGTVSASSGEPGWKADTTPVTFDWYIGYSWFENLWKGTTPEYITRKTGVNLNIIIPAGNEEEKLNTMIASGSLPDFVTLERDWEGVKKIQEGGLVWSLNELADKYDPYFYKTALPSVLGWFAQPDGKTYGYPNFSEAPERLTKDSKSASNQTFLVRKDMYEALGKPDMRTPEGFLAGLKSAKDKFPAVNGQPLIPLMVHEFTETGSWSLDEILCNFLAVPYQKDGKLYDRVTDPEYIRWMKTLRRANEMGLIAKDMFIDKQAQIMEKAAQGRYFSMLYQRTDISIQQVERYAQDPNSVYIAVNGPANTRLDPPRLRGGSISGWTLSFISKANRNPARAVRFLTYAISEEGLKDFWLGEKGVTWDVIDGKEQFKPEVVQLLQTDRTAFDKKYGAHDTFWMLMERQITARWDPPTAEPEKQPMEWTWGKVVSLSAFDGLEPPADSEEGITAKKVGEKWGIIQTKLLLAKSDAEFDTLLKEFTDYRASVGWDKLRAFQQRKYEENLRKLGQGV